MGILQLWYTPIQLQDSLNFFCQILIKRKIDFTCNKMRRFFQIRWKILYEKHALTNINTESSAL